MSRPAKWKARTAIVIAILVGMFCAWSCLSPVSHYAKRERLLVAFLRALEIHLHQANPQSFDSTKAAISSLKRMAIGDPTRSIMQSHLLEFEELETSGEAWIELDWTKIKPRKTAASILIPDLGILAGGISPPFTCVLRNPSAAVTDVKGCFMSSDKMLFRNRDDYSQWESTYLAINSNRSIINSEGKILTISSGAGKVSYDYDTTGRIAKMTVRQTGSSIVIYVPQYDAIGIIESLDIEGE
jgi:hypothetical protein